MQIKIVCITISTESGKHIFGIIHKSNLLSILHLAGGVPKYYNIIVPIIIYIIAHCHT